MADELFFNNNLALKDDMEAAGADYDRLATEIVRDNDDTPDSCAREAMFLGYAKQTSGDVSPAERKSFGAEVE